MEIPDSHFRHILLYYFRKGKNVVQAQKKLYDVYGIKSLTYFQFQNWFACFRPGDFDLKDAPCSGRPTEVDDDKIKAKIENNRRSTTREIAEKLNISHTCVERHLKQLGYVIRLGIWVPHKLNEIQLTKRISICDSLLKRNETDPFLKRIMLSVWWDFKGIVYFELLPRNQTINSNVYCRQLMKLDKEVKEKRPELAARKGVKFHQDNARPHTSLDS